MLDLRQLTKRYHGRTVVNKLDLSISDGELYVFLGPNGAGKTTTIRMIAGLLRPDSGTIHINGIDLRKHPLQAKMQFGFMPDQPYLYERLTPREFLRFIGGLYGLSPRRCDHEIDVWLERFNLSMFESELLGAFSHGMRQKVSLAAALIHDPPMLIVDEPIVGLDPRGAVTIKEVFKERSLHGKSAFICTHSLDVAQELAHRIGILHSGVLIAEGTIQTLQQQAKMREGKLEEIFLELTESQTDPELTSKI